MRLLGEVITSPFLGESEKVRRLTADLTKSSLTKYGINPLYLHLLAGFRSRAN
jgi:hypothetical protein